MSAESTDPPENPEAVAVEETDQAESDPAPTPVADPDPEPVSTPVTDEPATPPPASVYTNLGGESPLGRPGTDDTGPDDLRLGRFEEATGSTYRARVTANRGATAFGPNAVAVQVELRNGERITFTRYQVLPEDLDRLGRRYVKGPTFGPALDTLDKRRVVVIRGADGTGRRAAASILLDHLRRENLIDTVGGLVMPADVSVNDVARQSDVLAARAGMVLEIDDVTELNAGSSLDAYRTMAHQAHGYLVLLGPSYDDNAGPYTLTHECPNPAEVLKRYLTTELPAGFPAPKRQKALEDPAVVGYLGHHRLPGQVVKLAAALVDRLPRGQTAEQVVSDLEPDWRTVARRALDDAVAVTDAFGGPRRQALRTAYAVLDGLELADVLSAAEELLGMLRLVEAPDSSPARRVFDDGLDNLLFPDMLGGLTDETDRGVSPRRARLRHPALSDAFLDVAWNDYDTTRVVLLYWLDKLAVGGRPSVRRRAAEAAGKLAVYDFEKVMADLIRPWALNTNGGRRQAAAWAVEQVGGELQFADRVRRRVADWVRSSDPELHDTAAKVYGTLVGREIPGPAMSSLRTIAADRRQLRYRSVSRAVANIYQADAGIVLDHLDAWLDDPSLDVPVHATWALLYLACILDPDRSGWPRLLSDTTGTPDHERVLARLWTAALDDPATAYPAWELLRQWLELRCRVAPADDDLSGALADLVMNALATPALRKRGRWHLDIWRKRLPGDPLLTDLLDRLKKG
ncbi:MAG TPA: hypothetical protein VN408_18700 [Actinoplanes sp.]|nr:hypothetical protein [Actinoplanes sp.]